MTEILEDAEKFMDLLYVWQEECDKQIEEQRIDDEHEMFAVESNHIYNKLLELFTSGLLEAHMRGRIYHSTGEKEKPAEVAASLREYAKSLLCSKL